MMYEHNIRHKFYLGVTHHRLAKPRNSFQTNYVKLLNRLSESKCFLNNDSFKL